ncbi:MAG: hypothetical protein QOJ11_4178 [Frankiales bacterium]|jgi:hypothetical protein|nr:hypothetical protein [Frankiales bacterium]
MLELRIDSVAEPLASDVRAAWAAAHLVARAQYVGALPSLPAGQELGRPLLEAVLSGLAAHGVARDACLALRSARTGEEFRLLLEAANEQLEQSPIPAGTWPALCRALGEELLAGLVDVSAASLRRYSQGARTTPQLVAQRLHYLALLVADLSGAYNDYGVRRWFTRQRQQLGGLAPCELLAHGFDADGKPAQRVRELVDSLSAAGAA